MLRANGAPRRLTLHPDPAISAQYSLVHMSLHFAEASDTAAKRIAQMRQIADRFTNWIRGDGVTSQLSASAGRLWLVACVACAGGVCGAGGAGCVGRVHRRWGVGAGTWGAQALARGRMPMPLTNDATRQALARPARTRGCTQARLVSDASGAEVPVSWTWWKENQYLDITAMLTIAGNYTFEVFRTHSDSTTERVPLQLNAIFNK